IEFRQRFTVNPALADDLKSEAPGILAWCVRGALSWQADGLQAPTVVMEATGDYERDSDPLAAFMAEACDLDSHASVGAKDLFDHDKHWADQQSLSDRERLSSTAFGRKVGERFRQERSRSGKTYFGISRRTL